MDHVYGSFCWDDAKEAANVKKHSVGFHTATLAFKDPANKVYTDERHGHVEDRYFCFGKVGHRVLTVRFVYRGGLIRIYGAGYWRKGRRYYEQTEA